MSDAFIPVNSSDKPTQNRAVIHLDLDSFYCSVEILNHPDYKNKPIVVGGTPENRGVVASASYEARKFGIHSAMSSYKAQMLCNTLVIVPPNFKQYRKFSRIVMAIANKESDIFEQVSIDEAYLDVTDRINKWDEAIAIGEKLKLKIQASIGLTASFGIGTNKLIAKVASEYSKPNGFKVVYPGEEAAFLAPLHVSSIPGIGKNTEMLLVKMIITKVRDIYRCDRNKLIKVFGKNGSRMIQLARGIDNSPVNTITTRKSISSELTFKSDIKSLSVLEDNLKILVQKISKEMKAKNISGRIITVKIRYYDFETINRQYSMQNSTNDNETIYSIAKKLLIENVNDKKPVRLIGIGIKDLNNYELQLKIFN